MSPAQRQGLFENTARALGDAPKEIQLRHVRNCLKADPAYAKGVAAALRIEVPRADGRALDPGRRAREAGRLAGRLGLRGTRPTGAALLRSAASSWAAALACRWRAGWG
jgi:hypothetical protein